MTSPDLDRTHDPARTSWVESARGHADFPIQNLPFGVFRVRDDDEPPRVGVAIGDRILDLTACHDEGRFTGAAERAAEACAAPMLNPLMALPAADRAELRRQISDLLDAESPAWKANRRLGDRLLVSMADAELLLPAAIGDYTDFYASVHHATNVGSMFRPDNPLLPNYKWVPIGYHGRASSIVPSGTPVRRPKGQVKPPDAEAPVYAPSRSLDYEMELGCFVAGENPLGEAASVDAAEDRLFGVCLVNDWSARDVQAWEYQPLGPFLAKNFATTVSPWVVTLEALAPFRAPAFRRPAGDPAPLPYLQSDRNERAGAFDIVVEVYLSTARMRESGAAPARLSRGRVADLYWTPAQMLAHHASNGCNLRPGDLFASGTVSGPERDQRGSLLELTWRGAEPLDLPGGETRKFLEDGDEVIMRGHCEREGAVRLGL
ncbi:MAG TPA: fumarylacetoacetase, partial [Gemmatimonadales bacterium]|nr:fumarylacetoacetase [Gemmatimonadales bacterium]